MADKVKLNESQITKIVYESVKKLMNEGLFQRTRMEGSPQSLKDVFKGNGWTARTVSKDKNAGTITVRCYKSSDNLLGPTDSLPFDKLVEDIKDYCEMNNKPFRPYPIENESGSFITFKP